MNESSGQREVAMLQPFTRKDLVIRSLPDRLNDCPQMLYLYPDIPKVIVSLYLRSLSITLNVNLVASPCFWETVSNSLQSLNSRM